MKYFDAYLLPLLLLWSSKIFGSNYLWDLNDDPTETTNLYDKDDYEVLRTELVERLAYWQDQLVSDDDSETVDTKVKDEAFKACGGICTYENDTYSLSIDQIYFPENPPHIIFVLVDDWGYNDIGLRSTYMNWTTPTIDKLAKEGIFLENYFTHDFCAPTRAALLTGRFPGRMGLLNDLDGDLSMPVAEVTLAQELKSAGYETHMVGKWDLGFASLSRLPTYRGFDSFFGNYCGFMDYYTKLYNDYLDLHDGAELATAAWELSDDYHGGLLLEKKVEIFLQEYAMNSTQKPFFLYYAMNLVHSPYEVPDRYSERCNYTSTAFDDYIYCGMNLMLDEAIANLTCVLDEYDMLNKTVFILASDNGGASEISGDSVPFRGHKYDLNRGGVSANAFITSSLIPEDLRGTTYYGQMHVSDWLPTIMSLVTNGEWTGGYTNNTIDGQNMWDAIITNSSSPRTEIIHYVNHAGEGSIQINMLKLDVGFNASDFDEVADYFPADLAYENSRTLCSNPYIDDDSTDDYSLPTRSPTMTAAPTEEVVTVSPSEETATAAPTEEVVTVSPSEETATAAPTEEVVTVSPSEETATAAPSEEVVILIPTEKPVTAVPIEEVTAAPSEEAVTSSPTEDVVIVIPTENPTMTVSPTEEAVTAAPSEDAVTSSPTEDVVIVIPTENPTMTVSPTEEAVTAAPSEETATAAPTEEVVIVIPTEKPVTAAPTGKVTASPSEKPVTASPTDEKTVAPSNEAMMTSPTSGPSNEALTTLPTPQGVISVPSNEATTMSPTPQGVISAPSNEAMTMSPTPQGVISAPSNEAMTMSPTPQGVISVPANEAATALPTPQGIVPSNEAATAYPAGEAVVVIAGAPSMQTVAMSAKSTQQNVKSPAEHLRRP